MRGQTAAASVWWVSWVVGVGRHVDAADLVVGVLCGACGLPDRKLDKLAAQRKCMKCAT